MQKKHMLELRRRDRREFVLVCLFSISLVMYALVAMISRS
jgi:hypothetical protein